MKARRILDIAVLFATFGGAVLAVAALKDLFDHFGSLSWIYRLMVVAGVATLLVALVALFAWFAMNAISASARAVETSYVIGTVRTDQLEAYHGLCRSILGEGVASLEKLRQWHGKNPDTVWAVYRQRSRGLRHKIEMVGFFSVFPVTKQASELLFKNQLKGTELGPQHIVSRGRTPAATYIGAVGAKGFRAKERTLGALMGYVTSPARKTLLLFTRPVTKDGLRLAWQQGFEPVQKLSPASSDEEGETIFVRRMPA